MSGPCRTVRVFISSTFRDMHAEREELVKRVFPRLRKLCEDRGIGLVDVDLRWGVSEEQTQRGEVLPVCLAEIEHCRPFFIGLLGDRYGWVPQEIPAELVELQPWLAEHCEKSVTELEILHGVLNNPDMANRACFYFRAAAFLDRIPAHERADFIEADPGRRAKLESLKDRIRRSGLALRENYPDPQTLGRWVLEDLTAAINQMYPPDGKALDPLDRDAAAHEAFARSRAGVYVARPDDLSRLDRHAADDGPPIVVVGAPGSGKSALVANWALRYREEHRDAFMLMHFIGATPDSADWSAMLRRIMGEWKRHFGIPLEIPDGVDALRDAFANALHMTAARGGAVVVLDALDQLEERDGARELVWLPPMIPARIRLVLTGLPGRALEDLQRRRWPALTVGPLNAEERRRLIADYLVQYTKRLSASQLERIAGTEQAGNPLYLRILLNELRVFGDRLLLDKRISDYLAAADVPELYARVLARWEADYERDRPALVRDAMTCIWAARRGLAEPELLAMLGAPDGPLPAAHWTPLRLAAEQSLIDRSGLIGFSHDALREAVRRRYVPQEALRRAAHLRLADHFATRDLDRRQIDELPWHLSQAHDWDRLYKVLAEEAFFMASCDADEGKNQFEVRRYWSEIESSTPRRMTEAYRAVIANPGQTGDPNTVYQVARLLADSGRVRDAIPLIQNLVERCSSSGSARDVVHMLWTLATFLLDAGERQAAFHLNIELGRIFRMLGDGRGEAAALMNQSDLFRDRGEVHRALRLLETANRLLRACNATVELAACLGKQAAIHQLLQDYFPALQILDEKERLDRAAGDYAGLAHALDLRAAMSVSQGNLDDALRSYALEEQYCRTQGDQVGLQRALGGQAVAKNLQGDLPEALRLAGLAEEVCRNIRNMAGLACCLGVRGRILRHMGRLDEARIAQEAEESLARQSGNNIQVVGSLTEQAITAQLAGRTADAMRLREKAQEVLGATDLARLANDSIDPKKSNTTPQSFSSGKPGLLGLALVALLL